VTSARNLRLAAAVSLLTLGFGEMWLRLVHPLPDPYEHVKWREDDVRPQYVASQFDPHLQVTFIAEAGLPGILGRTSFSTNNAGFRGDPLRVPKPPDEIRVFMVGGSTTECLVLDDADAVTAVLQRELQKGIRAGRTVKVYGAGKSGDRTDDHLAMIVHRVLLLEPDLVIVFPGINDLRAAIAGYDFRHYNYDISGGSEPPPDDQGPPQRLGFWSLMRLSACEFQLGRALHALLRRARQGAPRLTCPGRRSKT
jgi:lysophospholipase L1-like esterase